MRPYIFQESDLQLAFDPDFYIRKYDETAVYQWLSGHGLRAVDFIGQHPDGRAFMMEVKNYTHRPARELDNIRRKISGNQPPVFTQMLQKIEDTRRAIQTIDTYLSSKWWWRLRYRIWSSLRLQKAILSHDRLYWMELARRIEKAEIILYLQLPKDWQEACEHLHHLSKDYPFDLVINGSHPVNFELKVIS